MSDHPEQAHYSQSGADDGCLVAIGLWLLFGAVGTVFAAPLYFAGASLVKASITGAFCVTLVLILCHLVVGMIWRLRMRRTRGLPVAIGERVVFTHGPLVDRGAFVTMIGQSSYDYEVRLEDDPSADAEEAPEPTDGTTPGIWVSAKDVRRA